MVGCNVRLWKRNRTVGLSETKQLKSDEYGWSVIGCNVRLWKRNRTVGLSETKQLKSDEYGWSVIGCNVRLWKRNRTVGLSETKQLKSDEYGWSVIGCNVRLCSDDTILHYFWSCLIQGGGGGGGGRQALAPYRPGYLRHCSLGQSWSGWWLCHRAWVNWENFQLQCHSLWLIIPFFSIIFFLFWML